MNDEANNQRGKKKKKNTTRGICNSGAKSQWKKLSMTKSENM